MTTPPLRVRSSVLHGIGALAMLALLSACMSDPAIPRTSQSRAYHFNDIDRDGDDRLTPGELEPHLLLFRDFAFFDTDDNGWIGRGEFDAYLDTMDDH